MKLLKNILSILTVLFSALYLLRVISFDIALPVVEILLATYVLLTGIECKRKGNKRCFIFNCLIALFVYISVIYIIFFE